MRSAPARQNWRSASVRRSPSQADIALGNVVGSNIFNVLFILGTSALIGALVVAQQLIRLDVPLMIGVSLLSLRHLARRAAGLQHRDDRVCRAADRSHPGGVGVSRLA